MCGNARRAGIFVALKCLDAPQRKHETACAHYKIRPDTQRPGNLSRSYQLAAGNQPDALLQAVAAENIRHERQTLPYRQTHIIDEAHGRGTRPAIGAVDGDEIRRMLCTTPVDFFAELLQPAVRANDTLEARRFTCRLAHSGNHFKQLFGVVNVRMTVRAERALANVDGSDAGDFCRDFVTRKYSAFAWLRTLTQFDFEHFHLLVRRDFLQPLRRQTSSLITYAVFRRANLKNDVGSAIEVILRQRTFPGIHPAAGFTRAV